MSTLRASGIRVSPIPAYCQFWNGTAERFNGSLLQIVRALLSDSELPLMFWVDAVAHATRRYNRKPHSYVDSKTPFQMFYGKLPLLHHFLIFSGGHSAGLQNIRPSVAIQLSAKLCMRRLPLYRKVNEEDEFSYIVDIVCLVVALGDVTKQVRAWRSCCELTILASDTNFVMYLTVFLISPISLSTHSS